MSRIHMKYFPNDILHVCVVFRWEGRTACGIQDHLLHSTYFKDTAICMHESFSMINTLETCTL